MYTTASMDLRIEFANLHFGITQAYIEDFATQMTEQHLGRATQYADDVIYNVNVLKQFLQTGDLDALEQGIMQQDTLVREYYYQALKWIYHLREEFR